MSKAITTLGEYLLPVKSLSPASIYGDDDFQYLDIASVDREVRNVTAAQTIPTAEAPSRARQLVQATDIIISTVRPNLNTVATIETEQDGAIASTGFCVLRVNSKKLDYRYLYHWISSQKSVDYLVSVATGASYPAVSDKIIKGMAFNPPDLEEQKRIAAILDKADSLRRKRAQAIALADDFLRATFLEMFGDPVTNPKGWAIAPIKKIANVITGNTPSRNVPEYFGDFIEWIKSDNINTPSHFLTQATEGLSEAGLHIGRMAPEGSVLMTCIAGSLSCIGNIALTDRKVAFNQQINALVPLRVVKTEFLYVCLLLSKEKIQNASTNSMKGMVSKGSLENVELILPPIEAQEKFVLLFHSLLLFQARFDASNISMVKLINSLETIFN